MAIQSFPNLRKLRSRALVCTSLQRQPTVWPNSLGISFCFLPISQSSLELNKMAKSYKICTVQKFDVPVTVQPFPISPQFTMEGIPEAPQTSIHKARDMADVEDFQSLFIEHEHEVSAHGRINQQRFEKYIRKGFMHAYRSEARSLLLLAGKKDDILSFCRYTEQVEDIRLATLRIDMKALLARLAEVKLVWFRFPAGMIHAS